MEIGIIIALFAVYEKITKEEIWICISNCGV